MERRIVTATEVGVEVFVGRAMERAVRSQELVDIEPVEVGSNAVPRYFDADMVALAKSGAEVLFFRLSTRTVCAVIREPDGWETVGFCQTAKPENFNMYEAKYRALYNAMKERKPRTDREYRVR